ncbi:amidase family protein, partial [Providencia stuartii]|uniref:amidase family protein n=1 Tax=Providencia stuartii TaxID=588 RepID=UPI0027BAA36E
GKGTGPLHGVPVAIKDVIETSDYPTEHGSQAFVGNRPQTDAACVAALRAAGAVILGKTVTTELAARHP